MSRNDSCDWIRIPRILPFIEDGVWVSDFAAIGSLPMATLANRRPITERIRPGRINSGTVVHDFASIYAGSFIGRDCLVGCHATVREDTRIGNRCVIGVGADIQYGVTVADDVRILNQAQIAGGSSIGRGSFIGPGVQTANDPHVARHGLEEYRNRGQVGVTIGEFVFVGVGAILLPGVSIGDHAIIAAGAVVTRDVRPDTMIVAPGVRGVDKESASPVAPIELTIARLNIQDADVVVMKYAGFLTDDVRERITEYVGTVFAGGPRCMLVDENFDMSAFRAAHSELPKPADFMAR